MGKMIMALKKLAKKINGKAPESDNVVGVINGMADDYQGGGAGGGQHLIKVNFNYSYGDEPELAYLMTYVTDTTLQTFDDLYDYLINKFGDASYEHYLQPVFTRDPIFDQGSAVNEMCCGMDAFFEDDTKCIEIIVNTNSLNVYIQNDEHFSITYFD